MVTIKFNKLFVFSLAVLFLMISSVSALTVASEDFESGGFSGGSGWADPSWTTTDTSVQVFDVQEPYEGSYHVRVEKYFTYLWRSVNLQGQSDLVLSFAYRSDSDANSNKVWIDDGTPRLVLDYTRTPGDSSWKTIEIPLEPSEYVNGLVLKFGNEGSKRRGYVFYDFIKIKDATPQLPVTVTLTSPSNGATTSTINPTLTWSSDNPAENYHLIIDDNSDFSSPVVDDNTLISSFYNSNLDAETTYYWKVQAKDSLDTWWDWSDTWTFTTPAIVTNEIIIQAEDFDNSYDMTAGNGELVYRFDTDTEIIHSHDHFFYNGYSIIDMENGDWVEYNVNIPQTDVWTMTFRGGYLNFNFDLYIDGQLYQSVDGTETDLFFDYEDTIVSNVALSEGPHVIKVVFTSGTTGLGGRLDYIRLTSETNPPAPLQIPSKPYSDAPPTAPANFVKVVDEKGKIIADGKYLKYENTGEVVQLRGYAVHGPVFFPTIPNNTLYNLVYSVPTTPTENGMNIVRIPVYPNYGGYVQGSSAQRQWTDNKVLELINEAQDLGIYIIISWHYHGNPTDYTSEAIAYFSWLSSQVGDVNNVIYEIINEPDGSTNWATVKGYVDQVIPVIRANDPDNLILVGTPYWDQHVDDALTDPVTDANHAYTFHFYCAVHDTALWDRIDNVLDAGYPVFVSEWSPGHYDWTIGTYNFAVSDNFIDFMESRGIPWVDWQFSPKGEILSALHWDKQYYGPWQTSDYTEGGLYINDKMNNPYPEIITSGIAVSDIPVSGTVSGTYENTHVSDNVYQSITEVETLGGPSTRYTYLEHKWTIDVAQGTDITFNLEAHHTSNTEGDNFDFYYSTDDVNYNYMLTVTKTSDDNSVQSFVLPSSISGTVYIKVVDTDHTGGNRNKDTIYIDNMNILSN